MPIALLDVNVLLALAWPNHVDHQTASVWLRMQLPQVWATCPITQCGFVRISSNPRLSQMSATPGTAWELLSKLVSLPRHFFWPDDLQLGDVFDNFGLKIVGHQPVTDAYLIALAKRHNAKLATFDRGAASLGGATKPDVELIAL